MHTNVPLEGDVVQQARVIRHLAQGAHQGIVFRLDDQNTGVFWRDQMSVLEWEEREIIYGVNSAHDVRITASVYSKKKQRWRIKVTVHGEHEDTEQPVSETGLFPSIIVNADDITHNITEMQGVASDDFLCISDPDAQPWEYFPLSEPSMNSEKNTQIPKRLLDYDTVRTSVLEMATRFPFRLGKQDIEVVGHLFSHSHLQRFSPKSAENEVDRLFLERLMKHVNEFGEKDDNLVGEYFVNSIKKTIFETLPLDLINELEKIVYATISNTQNPSVYDLALHYALCLELDNTSKQRFSVLLHSFSRIKGVLKNEVVYRDEKEILLKPNKLHPCFSMDNPLYGIELFFKAEILESVLNEDSLLDSSTATLYPQGIVSSWDDNQKYKLKYSEFMFKKNSSYEEYEWYDALETNYRELVDKGIGANIFKQEEFISSRSLEETEFYELSDYISTFYEHRSTFNDLLNQLEKTRKYITFDPKLDSKSTYRSILETFGDMSLPNPIRPLKKDLSFFKQNLVERIETLSKNHLNNQITNQNRIIGFIDMIFLNMHRRESYGNRFIGLDYLEELQKLSHNGREIGCAKLMLFHAQKVSRLMDGQLTGRTNKITRNNLFVRTLYSIETTLDNPAAKLFRNVNPLYDQSDSTIADSLSRLAYPIRIEKTGELDFEELPYGLIVQISADRIFKMVQGLEHLHEDFNDKVMEDPSSSSFTISLYRSFRLLSCMLLLEICQLHMMACYLPIEAKKSRIYYSKTRSVILSTSEEFESDSYDFSIPPDKLQWDKDSTILQHLKANEGTRTPLDLLRIIQIFCLPSQFENEGSEWRNHWSKQSVRFIALANEFCRNTQPKGVDYAHLAKEFDKIYYEQMPVFTSI
jgi:hypothetical protein